MVFSVRVVFRSDVHIQFRIDERNDRLLSLHKGDVLGDVHDNLVHTLETEAMAYSTVTKCVESANFVPRNVGRLRTREPRAHRCRCGHLNRFC
jgi:hypothetical protein